MKSNTVFLFIYLFILMLLFYFISFTEIKIVFLIFFSFIFISWRLITPQHFSGFCHTLTWISHGVTCIPHPDPPSPLPLHPITLGLPSAPGPCTCLMNPTWAGDVSLYIIYMLFYWNIPPSPSPIESKWLFCKSVSLFLFCI